MSNYVDLCSLANISVNLVYVMDDCMYR